MNAPRAPLRPLDEALEALLARARGEAHLGDDAAAAAARNKAAKLLRRKQSVD